MSDRQRGGVLPAAAGKIKEALIADTWHRCQLAAAGDRAALDDIGRDEAGDVSPERGPVFGSR